MRHLADSIRSTAEDSFIDSDFHNAKPWYGCWVIDGLYWYMIYAKKSNEYLNCATSVYTQVYLYTFIYVSNTRPYLTKSSSLIGISEEVRTSGLMEYSPFSLNLPMNLVDGEKLISHPIEGPSGNKG
jgi:hypothetical protein